MCRVMEELLLEEKAESKAEGLELGQLKSIVAICRKGRSIEEALELLDIPLDQWDKYRKLTEDALA